MEMARWERTLLVCPVPLILGCALLFPILAATFVSDWQEARDIARAPPRATMFATAYAGGRQNRHTRTDRSESINRSGRKGARGGRSPPRRSRRTGPKPRGRKRAAAEGLFRKTIIAFRGFYENIRIAY
jgi:hypothetical protein